MGEGMRIKAKFGSQGTDECEVTGKNNDDDRK